MSDEGISQQRLQLEELYLQKDFKKVRSLMVKDKNIYGAGQFHYNLATLYLKEKSYGPGIFHLQKAIKKGSVNSSTYNNLSISREMVSAKKIEPLAWNFVDLPDVIFLTLSLIFVLTVLLAKKLRIIKNLKIVVVLIIISITPWGFKEFVFNDIFGAIVLTSTEVKEGPSDIYEKIAGVGPGKRFVVTDVKDGWCRVIFPKDSKGWIKKSSLGLY